MKRKMVLGILLVVFFLLPFSFAGAQAIENELYLITPVSKDVHDPALKAFAAYAKKKWNIDVKTSAIPKGTPVAYGQILEWKGKPQADIFWGGEGTLFDALAKRGRGKAPVNRKSVSYARNFVFLVDTKRWVTALSNPIPVLEGVRDYVGFARGSEEHKLLMTRLMRKKKRVCDALRDAVERIDRTLADS